MAQVTLRNLGDIRRRDSLLGQALDDAVQHISTLKQQIAALQTQLAALQKK